MGSDRLALSVRGQVPVTIRAYDAADVGTGIGVTSADRPKP